MEELEVKLHREQWQLILDAISLVPQRSFREMAAGMLLDQLQPKEEEKKG